MAAAARAASQRRRRVEPRRGGSAAWARRAAAAAAAAAVLGWRWRRRRRRRRWRRGGGGGGGEAEAAEGGDEASCGIALALVSRLHGAALAARRAEALRVPGGRRQRARRGVRAARPEGARRDPRARGALRSSRPATTSPTARACQRFVAATIAAHRLEGGGGKVVLYVGEDDWPFPIPLVPDGPRWRWDTEAGRRGDPQSPHRTQRARRDPGVPGLRRRAARVLCAGPTGDGCSSTRSASQHRGQARRPLLADRPARSRARSARSSPGARGQGYRRRRARQARALSRLLLSHATRAGPDAPGGAYDYVVKGHMIGGFALVAYPGDVRQLGRHDVHREPRRRRVPEGSRAEDRAGREGDEDVQPRPTWRRPQPDTSQR